MILPQRLHQVDIIMAVSDVHTAHLRESINSVLMQTYEHFSFIIVLDDSPEHIRHICQQFSLDDNRIKLTYNSERKGLAYSLNLAISLGTAPLIFRQDADDISLKTRIQRQVDHMRRQPDIDICGSTAVVIDSQSRFRGIKFSPVSPEAIHFRLTIDNPLIHPSVCFRRTLVKNKNFYDDSFQVAQDYELWSRVVSKDNACNLILPCIKYRVHNKSVSISRRLLQVQHHELISMSINMRTAPPYLEEKCLQELVNYIVNPPSMSFPVKRADYVRLSLIYLCRYISKNASSLGLTGAIKVGLSYFLSVPKIIFKI